MKCMNSLFNINNVKESKEELIRRKFAWREGIEDIERESQKMVQGYRRKIYKWDEIDGDDLNMERLHEDLPPMRKRVYSQGTKHGKFISLYFMGGALAYVESTELINKTKTAVKLVKFFESIGKRTEVILFFKSRSAGYYKEQYVDPLVIEITIKRFSDPINIPLINTALSVWTFRYWKFLFMDAKMHGASGRGQSVDLIPEEDFIFRKGIYPIVINTHECLSKESSETFIQNILNNEKI